MAKRSGKIGASIVLDGEKEFRSAVTNCNKTLKTMKSEMGMVKEQYAQNANSMEALRAKQEVLTRTLSAHNEKVQATAAGLEHAKESYAKVGTALDQLKQKLEEERKKEEQMRQSATASEEEMSKQKKTVEELAVAVSKGEAKYQQAGNRVNDWKDRLNKANTEMYKTNNALEKNSRALDEARESTGRAEDAVDEYKRTVRQSGDEIEKMGNTSGEAFNALGEVIATAGIADKMRDVANAAEECSEAASDFETASAKISTIADTSSVSMEKMNKDVLALSKDTGKAAEDIGNATYDAISSGAKTENAVATVAQANKLAVGGFTDIASGVDVLTTSLNAYKMDASEASRVSDVLVATQNKGKITVGELGKQIGKVIPLAAAYNTNIENLGSTYAILTANGIKAEEATTYTKSMLKELGDTGSTVSKTLRSKTGKSFAELMASGKSLGDVIGILGKSVDNDKTAFNNMWSSTEAGTGALTLLNTGSKEYASTLKMMENSAGLTDQAFEKMSDTTEMAKEKMVNSMNNLKIAIGTELNKSLSNMAATGESAFDWATTFVQENPEVVRALTAVSVGIGVVTAAVGGFVVATKILIPLVNDLTVSMAANPFGAIAVAITASVAAIGTFISMQKSANKVEDEQAQKVKETIEELNSESDALKENIKTVQESRSSAESNVYAMDKQVARLEQLNNVEKKNQKQKTEMQALVKKLSQQVPELSEAYDAETGTLSLTNKQIEKKIKNYKKLYLVQAAQEDMEQLYKDEYTAQKNLKKAQDEMSESTLRVVAAKKKAQKAQAALTKEQEKNKNNPEYNENYSKTYQEALKANEEYVKVKDKEKKIQSDLTDTIGDYTKSIQDCENEIQDTQDYIENLGDTSEETSKKMKKSGENAVDGLIEGAKSKSSEYEQTFRELATKGQSAYNEAMDIHSPSRKMKKSGEHTVDGLIEGINAKKENVGKTMNELGELLIDQLETKISDKDLKTNGHGYSASKQASMWKAVTSVLKKGTSSYKEALRKYWSARNDAEDAAEQAADKAREKREKAKEKKEKEKERLENKNTKKVTKAQNAIENHELKTGTAYNSETIARQWKKVVSATKKGTEAHKEALANYLQARNEAMKALKAGYKDTLSNLRSEIKDLESDYKEAVASTKEGIMSSYGMFSGAETSKTNSAGGIIRNMQSQVEQIKKWKKDLQTLRDRGVSSNVMSELEGLGVSSAGDVETLANMTDDQLTQYQSLYEKKEQLASEEAAKENEAMKTKMDKDIKALQKEARQKLSKLQKTYSDEMKSMGYRASQGFAQGLKNGSSAVYKAISELTGRSVAKLKKDLGIHSPSKVFEELGGYTGLGYAKGLQKSTEGLTQILENNLPRKIESPLLTTQTRQAGASQTNLSVYMDSRLMGRATYSTIDGINEVNARLTERGVATSGLYNV